MTNLERAKQFAPFAALKGFEEYIHDMERETTERVILAEDAAQELDLMLQSVKVEDTVSVTYYKNGQYITADGTVKRIDQIEGYIQVGIIQIPTEDILSVQ